MTTIAVVDTSILVSNRNREHLLTAAFEGLYKPYWSPWIVAELNRVLTWNWVRNKGTVEKAGCSRRCKSMMSLLSSHFYCVDPKPPWLSAWPELTDPDDLPIWSTAKSVQAKYIVSGNSNDFPPTDRTGKHVWEGIEYLGVSDFLNRIGYEIDA